MSSIPGQTRAHARDAATVLNYDSVIIFFRTKHRPTGIAHLLKRNNHAGGGVAFQLELSASARRVEGFSRRNVFELLVATGHRRARLTSPTLSHVINYDVPQHPEDLHPPHRRARAGGGDGRQRSR